MTAGLKSFAKFSKNVRLTLLRDAEFRHYERGSFVFKQGDYGDNMYIILRGSCNVRISRKNKHGIIEDVIVNCLYDGDMFGELSMMGTSMKSKLQTKTTHLNKKAKTFSKQNGQSEATQSNTHISGRKSNKLSEMEALGLKSPVMIEDEKRYFERTKRAASIQVAQATDVLSIPRERFKVILMNVIQKKLDVKLKILLNLSFFEKIEPYLLIPLASNLSTKTFKMGEAILKEGETPTEFCIIAEGTLKVVKEMVVSKIRTQTNYTKGGGKPLRNFKFGIVDSIYFILSY